MLSPYVEKDPTKFCTYEDFEKGAEALKEFCVLRAESVSGQLGGSIPSTSDGQSADSSNLVSADGLELSATGNMGNGMKNQRINPSDETADGASSDSDGFAMPMPPDMPEVNRDQESTSENTRSQVEIMDTAVSNDASSEKYSEIPVESAISKGNSSFDFQSLVLLAMSAGVLITGITAAFIFKKKS